jgi:hypothetical protein
MGIAFNSKNKPSVAFARMRARAALPWNTSACGSAGLANGRPRNANTVEFRVLPVPQPTATSVTLVSV